MIWPTIIQCMCLNHSGEIYCVAVSTIRANSGRPPKQYNKMVDPSRTISNHNTVYLCPSRTTLIQPTRTTIHLNRSGKIYTVVVSTIRANSGRPPKQYNKIVDLSRTISDHNTGYLCPSRTTNGIQFGVCPIEIISWSIHTIFSIWSI
jgi:hypothetical protein